jgi:hypothetical protein
MRPAEEHLQPAANTKQTELGCSVPQGRTLCINEHGDSLSSTVHIGGSTWLGTGHMSRLSPAQSKMDTIALGLGLYEQAKACSV